MIRERWILEWPNGDAKSYDRLDDLASDISFGAFLEAPSSYLHLLEDGRYTDAEDDVNEAVESFETNARDDAAHRARRFA